MANLTGYTHYQIISVTGNKPAAPQAWFPMLVAFDADAGLTDHTQNAGLDIAFCVNGDDTELPYDRIFWVDFGATVTALFWVRVPSIASVADTDLRMHIGKAAGTAYATPSDTWNENGANNFKAVWPLGDVGWAGGAPEALDRTIYGNDGTNTGTVVALGSVGRGRDFSLDFITIPFDASLVTGPAWTVSGWVKPDTIVGVDRIFNRLLGPGDHEMTFELEDGDIQYAVTQADGASYMVASGGTALTAGVFEHVAGVFNDATPDIRVYKGGVPDGNSAVQVGVRNTNLSTSMIGRRNDAAANYFDGVIDELRVAATDRSAAWILFEYDNIADYAGTVTHGAWESAFTRPKVGGSLAAGRAGLVR